MSWISHAYECRLCMDLPEANSTTVRDLYCQWAACPCLSWSAVAMRALIWVVFVPQASFTPTLCSGSSLHRRMHESTRGRSVFMEYLNLLIWNLRYMAANRQTDIHTTSANAVTLVWGSLRLAPISLDYMRHLVQCEVDLYPQSLCYLRQQQHH